MLHISYVIYAYVISSIKYILSALFHPHKKRNPQQLCYASSVAIFIQRKKLLLISTISSQLIWAVLSKHFLRYFLNFSWSRKLTKNGNTLEICTRCISRCGLKKLWRGIKGINLNIYHSAWHYTQKWDDCVVVCRLVSFFSASKKAQTSSSANCICHYFLSLVAVIFHPPFPDFPDFPDTSDISSSWDLSKALSLQCLQLVIVDTTAAPVLYIVGQ